MGYNLLSEKNKKVVSLNLLSTAIWYSYAWIFEVLLLSIKDYAMPVYAIHVGFVFVILTLNILIGLFLVRTPNKELETLTDIPPLQEFTFVDPPGYYTHPKYPNQMLCPFCLIKSKLIAPVSKIDEKAWYCNVCDKPLSGTRGGVFSIDW